MKRWILKSYKNCSLFLYLWVFFGFLGSVEQFTNNEWQSSQLPENPFGVLALTPPFVVFILGFYALIIFLLQKGFESIFQKSIFSNLWKQVTKYLMNAVIILLYISLLVAFSIVSINDFRDGLKWGFYFQLLSDVVWFVYIIFVARRFWGVFRKAI